MTDSITISEIHRTNIEYERRRHLANWFSSSSPHMPKPTEIQQQQQEQLPSLPISTNITPTKSQQKSTSKNNNSGNTAPITQNPLFFLGKVNHASGGNLAMSRSAIFDSQTNLPVQMQVTQIGHKPKLRRFIPQYSNMFSVDDFENARLARRNELELKQRQLNRCKMNSLSSGGDCSTGDSKGSKFSNELLSNSELLLADSFLERFSLPRVVRISTIKFSDETMQSSSSNGSATSSTDDSMTNNNNKKNTTDMTTQPNGELLLLYRYLRNRKVFHGINAKNGANRKKGLMIPQEFSGYFSLINEKGAPTATIYTTITKLVREKVYKFLSVDNLTAYTETQSTNTFPSRPHYVKGTARGGQIFRLLAVFEDGKQDSSNHQSESTSFKNGNNAGRYAQLLNENRQVIYVSLISKGKFYEIEDSNHNSTLQRFQSLDQNTNGPAILKPKQDFADCVHRISSIISMDMKLPLNIRFIAVSQQGKNSSNDIPETITITKVTTDNCVIACPIEEFEARNPPYLKKISITPEMRFIKCFLGFENEMKMFSNQNIQNILRYCQFNCDSFSKMIEMEHIATTKHLSVTSTRHKVDGLKILSPLNLLRREKSMIAHEKEDSIIFLSKNDLENMESQEQANDSSGGIVSAKMKVFQTTRKKWFRNSKSNQGVDTELQNKRMSMDRYQDMSKLIQERFGGDTETNGKDDKRASSEIADPCEAIDSSKLVQNNTSMPDMDSCSDYSVKPNLAIDEITNDVGDMNDVEFMNRKSFITEKLCSEFHVKTKNHCKSSTNLQHLLHFSVPQKMNVNETKKVSSEDLDVTTSMKAIDFASMVAITCIDDDLPYSSVRDSLVYQPTIDDESFSSNVNRGQDHPDNIYAEICTEGGVQNGADGITVRDGNDNGVVSSSHSAIRISVGSSTPKLKLGLKSLPSSFDNTSDTHFNKTNLF